MWIPMWVLVVLAIIFIGPEALLWLVLFAGILWLVWQILKWSFIFLVAFIAWLIEPGNALSFVYGVMIAIVGFVVLGGVVSFISFISDKFGNKEKIDNAENEVKL